MDPVALYEHCSVGVGLAYRPEETKKVESYDGLAVIELVDDALEEL